jgi:hypothetical protein
MIAGTNYNHRCQNCGAFCNCCYGTSAVIVYSRPAYSNFDSSLERFSKRVKRSIKIGGRRAAPCDLDIAAIDIVQVLRPWLPPPTAVLGRHVPRHQAREVPPVRSRAGMSHAPTLS